MSRSARSVLVFGVYLVVLGLILLAIPNTLLAIFAFPAATDVWIRVVGMLLLLIAFYYVQAARLELREFFRLTVYARASVIVFFLLFVLLGWAKAPLILFGAIDLLGALWTASTLRPRPAGRALV